MLPEEVFVYNVGDRVCLKEKRDLCGKVISVVTDGKLSKDFITVKWDNGINETVLPEWLIPENFRDKDTGIYNKASIEKIEALEPFETDQFFWLNVVDGFKDEDKQKILASASVYKKGDDVIIYLPENRKIITNEKGRIKAAYVGETKVDNPYDLFNVYIEGGDIAIAKVKTNDGDMYKVSFQGLTTLLDYDSLYFFLDGIVDDVKQVLDALNKKGKVLLVSPEDNE